MTKIITINSEKDFYMLKEAAQAVRDGKLVAFPTETVYGLGADGLNESAVRNIYRAKGRPSDNPLILHIQSPEEITPLVNEINETARKLMNRFWPGPMTLVFKKSKIVPDVISGGLDTVAIRYPENRIACELIRLSKTPIAAPSANTSGKPSPTKAKHVYHDLNGKIDYIVNGGDCDIGLESTVIDVTGKIPIILRPGKISLEDIRELFADAYYDKHLTEITSKPVSKPRSPGMKYKHYAPSGELYILDGSYEKIQEYLDENADDDTAFLTFNEYPINRKNVWNMGCIHSPIEGSKVLFDILRECDEKNMKKIYSVMPEKNGVGFALFNRMFKAAGGKIVNLW